MGQMPTPEASRLSDFQCIENIQKQQSNKILFSTKPTLFKARIAE